MVDVISHSRDIEASPEAVFPRVIDIDGLPSWNAKIQEVVSRPGSVAEGAQWTVRVKANGSKWTSSSEVVELDRTERRFVHRSKRDGKNPSYALWTWTVEPSSAGAKLTVTCELHPKTFFLKHVLLPVRKGPLRKEMQASLDELSELVRAEQASDTT